MENTSDKHFELAVGLSKEALKAMLLVDGGGATALIALSDKGMHDYSICALIFGLSALAAVTAFGFGYGSQLAYANSRFQFEIAESTRNNNPARYLSAMGEQARQYKQHRRYQNIVLVLMVVNLIVAGCAICWAVAISGSPPIAKNVANF